MHLPIRTPEELVEDASLLLFLTSEPMPSAESIQRYQPKTWTKEELQMYLLRRKQLHNAEMNAVYDRQAKALEDLEKDFWMTEDHTPTDPAYFQAMKEQKASEIRTLAARFAHLADTINISYGRDIVPKIQQLEALRRGPNTTRSSYHIVPPVAKVPRTMPEFQQLKADYLKEELAKLLWKHMNHELSQHEIDLDRWWKGHQLEEFNPLRSDYLGHAQFREFLAKNYDHVRKRASAV